MATLLRSSAQEIPVSPPRHLLLTAEARASLPVFRQRPSTRPSPRLPLPTSSQTDNLIHVSRILHHHEDTFLELQRKKVHRYVIFKIDEKRKEVVVEKTGGAAESYDDFMGALPENDCRYAIYDFDFVTEENCQKSKIFFIAWSPSVSRIRAKMLYATSKDRFRRELDGVHYEIQATDPTELDIEVLRERAH